MQIYTFPKSSAIVVEMAVEMCCLCLVWFHLHTFRSWVSSTISIFSVSRQAQTWPLLMKWEYTAHTRTHTHTHAHIPHPCSKQHPSPITAGTHTHARTHAHAYTYTHKLRGSLCLSVTLCSCDARTPPTHPHIPGLNNTPVPHTHNTHTHAQIDI